MKNEERENGKWEKGGREKLLKNTLGKQHWLKPSSLCSAWNMYTSLDHCWGLLCMYLQTAHWLLVLLVLFIFKSFKLHLNSTGIPFFLSLSLFFSFSLLASLHLSIYITSLCYGLEKSFSFPISVKDPLQSCPINSTRFQWTNLESNGV